MSEWEPPDFLGPASERECLTEPMLENSRRISCCVDGESPEFVWKVLFCAVLGLNKSEPRPGLYYHPCLTATPDSTILLLTFKALQSHINFLYSIPRMDPMQSHSPNWTISVHFSALWPSGSQATYTKLELLSLFIVLHMLFHVIQSVQCHKQSCLCVFPALPLYVTLSVRTLLSPGPSATCGSHLWYTTFLAFWIWMWLWELKRGEVS